MRHRSGGHSVRDQRIMEINVRDNIAQVLASLDRYKSDVVAKAIPRALNRTIEMGRTAASRELPADGYTFKPSEIKDAISLIKANQGKLVATMRVQRVTKSLMQFSPQQTSAGVSVKIHRGRKLIRHAFIGQLRNGRYGVYVEDKTASKTVLRTRSGKRGNGKKITKGWHDYPVRKLYGPSVGGSYSTDAIQAIMQRVIGEAFTARLGHEIKNLSR
jgi:hypothetical protein